MNPSESGLQNVDEELLDCLVDGELPEARRRELLASLDRIPGGWRACALAFVQAQCLRESLGDVVRQSASRPVAVVPRPARRPGWGQHARTFLAMAASFLVALGVGWWAGAPRHAIGPGSPGLGPTPGLVASQGEGTGGSQAEPVAPVGPPGLPDAAPTMTVALPGGGSQGDQEIRLPVVEGDQIDHSLLYPDAQAFPSQLREALRRAGYQVRQHHGLVPVPVQDGRHAVLPVDQLDVRYVGNHVE